MTLTANQPKSDLSYLAWNTSDAQTSGKYHAPKNFKQDGSGAGIVELAPQEIATAIVKIA